MGSWVVLFFVASCYCHLSLSFSLRSPAFMPLHGYSFFFCPPPCGFSFTLAIVLEIFGNGRLRVDMSRPPSSPMAAFYTVFTFVFLPDLLFLSGRECY